MKHILLALLVSNLTFVSWAQVTEVPVADSLSVAPPSPADSTNSQPVPPTIVSDTTKKEIVTGNEVLTVKEEAKHSKITLADSLAFSKFFTVNAGFSSILNDRNDSVNFWKNGYTLGFSFGDHITKYLAYVFSFDYGVYKFDQERYLDYYEKELESLHSKNDVQFSDDEKNRIEAASKAKATEFASRTKNNLQTVQIGVGFLIKPIKIGIITPYALLGANVLLTTKTITLLRPLDIKNSEVTQVRTTYINNSSDAGISILAGLGVQAELSKRISAFAEAKYTFANDARRSYYGKLQWDILSVKAGFVFKIK